MDDFDFVRLGDSRQTHVSFTFSDQVGGTITVRSPEGIVLLAILKELTAIRALLDAEKGK